MDVGRGIKGFFVADLSRSEGLLVGRASLCSRSPIALVSWSIYFWWMWWLTCIFCDIFI